MIEDKDIHPIAIEDEMKGSYIDYAMSVIVARALPDARDGLKPVHRRILYGMHELHLGAGKPFKKSARIVGEVMGKYHPHGDSAIYDTLVRMAQDFSLRYPLVDGQGNFGSIDGDSAAAYRYTEARLEKMAEELLADIDKETVPFRPNFDESLDEPVVLPSRIPALLVNGADGIAVGMATKIPPHNLGEVVDAMVRLIDEPDLPTDELLKIVPGPDFPTGGLIVKSGEIARAYKTGRGKLIVRGKTFTEVSSSGRTRIIISEIPYQVNKAKLIEDTAKLVREKKIEGISDIRDESDRKGMRIVLELKKDVSDEIVVNKLLRYTNLQTTFGVNMVALSDGRPMVMNLKRLCKEFLGHRREVVTRRCRYELRKAEERVHILEGLKIAVDNIDEVIKIIRGSKDSDVARIQLMERFGLSEIQAKAILDMRLHRLTGLEIDKLVEELEALRARVQELREILGDVKRIYAIVKDELVDVKNRYGDPRRTQFILDTGLLDERDLLEDEQKVITLTTGGYIKSMPADTYVSQGRGGKGMKGISLKDEDLVERVFIASTFDYMLFFTNRARCFAMEVWKIPEGSRQAKGKAVVNLLSLGKNETVTAILPIKGFEKDQHLVIATKKGRIKRSRLAAYGSSTRASGIIGFKFAEPDDELVNVRIAQAGDTIVLGTRNGKAIHFKSGDVRLCGRVSQGVKGVDLERGDEVVGMEVIKEKATLLVVTENGYGKRTDIEEYRVQSRGGKGIINIKVNPRNGVVAGFREVQDEDEIMVSTAEGKIIRIEASTVSKIGRNTQGVRIIDCADGDQVVAVTVIRADEESAEEGESGMGGEAEDADGADVVADDVDDEDLDDEDLDDEDLDDEEV